MKVHIRLKLALLLIAVAVIPLIVALAAILLQGRQMQTNFIGQTEKSVASTLAAQLQGSLMTEVTKILLELQDDPHTATQLTQHNRLRSPAELDELDALWKKLWDDKQKGVAVEDHPRLRKLLKGHIADHLETLQVNIPEIAEILVTDRHGQLVAATGLTEDYYQADEQWWLEAFNEGRGKVFIPPVAYDQSAGVWSVDICLPLFYEQSIVGVVKAVVNLSHWIHRSRAFVELDLKMSQGLLTNTDGTVIFPESAQETIGKLSNWDAIAAAGEAGWRVTDKAMVQAYARVSLPNQIRDMDVVAPDWFLVVQMPQAVLMEKVNPLTWLVGATGVLLIAIVFMLGLYLVDRSIGRRIRNLQIVAHAVGQGDLSRRVPAEARTSRLVGGDELDELSDVFNSMIDGVEKSHEELREANALKANFIKIAGHELRTPVSYIMTLPKLMAGSTDVAKLQEGMRSMEAKARRLSAIIQSMFKLMPGQEYSHHLEYSDVPLGEVLDDVVCDTKPFVEERHQTLLIDQREDLPTLRVDRGKIRDVIENLVGNAIKFTPDGGEIRVVAARQLDEKVAVSVIDEGPGIAPEDIRNIFNPFFSTDDVMRHSSGAIGFQKRGMGLGLAVVKHFTELHGGTVHVTTGASGSTFTVTLPITPPKEEKESSATPD
ncbi:MAG: sensor histidine kinase [Planctomycetota bacterium]|jgi:signal transduction histidine kinase